MHEENNQSPNSVDIFSFHKIFLECDIAQRVIFKGKSSGIIQTFTMDVGPGYKYIKTFVVVFNGVCLVVKILF